jgi:class 3 adenylate cyclase/tetratricopeptide (TPR) repeat protein
MAEARKTVTVVFTDVSGSTSLGESLDPEAMRRVMERYFAEMRTVIERHGGTVEKFIGDAVMAVFGIPQVHEDDALRAVRAAAEMRERLAFVNDELERERGVMLAVRTGVNTGEVVAGDPSAGEFYATGDAVNVAARLEQAATPGDVLLGPLTYRLVREAVRAEAVEPLALKGKAKPLEAWRLVEVLPDVPAYTRRIDAPFVGRGDELALLQAAFERVREGGRCELVTVLGAPGIGKSRLARELLSEAGPEARPLVGRCLPYGEGITYWPLAEIVRQAAGTDVERGLREVLADEPDAPLITERIAAALGVVDTPARTEEIFWATRRLLERLASERPVVVVLDDVHWAEPTLLDLLEYVTGFASAPLLLLCLARPDLLDVRPQWPRAGLVELDALAQQDAEALIAGLLAGSAISQSLSRRIVETADGNPLFVEQMLALARESGNGEVTVPPTIQALLAARLDRLAAPERAVLERGAIEGRLFHRGAVSALSPEPERDDVATRLITLARSEFVRPDRSLFPGDDAFRFVHVLVRDAAYEATPKALRAELHERFAAWLEGRANGRLAEVEEILGYHLEQSFLYRAELGVVDDRTRALAADASARLGAAGKRAFDRGDVDATRNLLGRAFNLSPPHDDRRYEVFADLVEAQLALGDYAGAEALIAEVRSDGNARLAAYAGIYDGLLRMQIDPEGSSERALEAADAAVRMFEQAGDDPGLARAWMVVGWVHWQRGALSKTREANERALAAAVRAGDRRQEAEAYKVIGACRYFGAAPIPETIRDVEERLDWARSRGDIMSEGEMLGALAVCLATQSRFEEASSLAERAEALLEELGARVHVASFGALAHVAYLAGDFEGAETHYRRNVDTLSAFGDRSFLSTQAVNLARVLCDLGRPDEARALIETSRAAGASDDVTTQAGWRSVQARIFAEQGNRSEAERLATEAIALIAPTEYLDLHAETLLAAGQAFARVGNREAAQEAIAEAARLYDRKGNLVMAAQARARLSELRSLAVE